MVCNRHGHSEGLIKRETAHKQHKRRVETVLIFFFFIMRLVETFSSKSQTAHIVQMLAIKILFNKIEGGCSGLDLNYSRGLCVC